MFDFFFKKPFKKNREIKIFVCKHCKLTCKECASTFCFACYANDENPCPRCGKINKKDKTN